MGKLGVKSVNAAHKNGTSQLPFLLLNKPEYDALTCTSASQVWQLHLFGQDHTAGHPTLDSKVPVLVCSLKASFQKAVSSHAPHCEVAWICAKVSEEQY